MKSHFTSIRCSVSRNTKKYLPTFSFLPINLKTFTCFASLRWPVSRNRENIYLHKPIQLFAVKDSFENVYKKLPFTSLRWPVS